MGQWCSSLPRRGGTCHRVSDGSVARDISAAGLDLPEELLGLIIESAAGHQQLAPNEDCWQHVQMLRSLCMTSKKLRRLAEPVLYRFIVWPAGKPGSACRVRRLLRTIIARPDLRNCILDVHIGVDQYTQAEDKETACQDLRDVDWKAYRTALGELFTLGGYGIKHRELLQHLRDGQGYASWTLLLTSCKKIRRIDLQLWPGWEESSIGRILQAAGTFNTQNLASGFVAPYHLLPELKEYTLTHGAPEGCTLMEDVQNLLCHATLCTLRGRSLSLQEDELREFLVRRTNLRTIELTNSLLDAAGFASLLGVCTKLESLSVHWGSLTVGDCIIEWHSIGDALRQFGPRLIKLRLEPNDAFQFDEASFNTSHRPLGDLTPLSMLQILQVPAMCLVGLDLPQVQGSGAFEVNDLLPRSLQEIDILDFRGGCTLSEQQVLSMTSSTRLGNLEKIVLGRMNIDSQAIESQGWSIWPRPLSASGSGRMTLARRKAGQI